MRKLSIKTVLLLELVLFLIVVFFIASVSGVNNLTIFLDIPSIIVIVLFVVPGMLIMGEGKDFRKAFSVGKKDYSLVELKNIVLAVGAAEKLVAFATIISLVISSIVILMHLSDPALLGPYVAVALITVLYGVSLEFFLLPLKINAEKAMNKEIDMDDED